MPKRWTCTIRAAAPGCPFPVSYKHLDVYKRQASFDADEASLIWQARKTDSFDTTGGGSRSFCPDCGSSLGIRAADGSFSVEAGCIDNPTGGSLTRHIFTTDKADYVVLDDGLPQDPQG